ncbi:ATP-binding protein [Parvularcula maris]|uniref:histidine kinase n=1 Tax=Parvularcula maris TaxID=2965077 RepID=A0A9X2RIP4_9PROT|nr:ATP-binding protein [Parvularcula maris]MCQ8184052.1 ATP-binding protein [Parvularcula maris]
MAMPQTEKEEARLELSQLKAIARSRSRQLATRLGLAVTGAAFIAVSVSTFWAVTCLLLIFASQALEAGVRLRFLPSTRRRPISSIEMGLFVVTAVLASAFYGSIALAAWVLGDVSLKVYAAFWLAGSMLHCVVHMYHHRIIFLCGFIPHAVLAVCLPLLGIAWGEGGWAPQQLIAPTFSAVMFGIHAFLAYRIYRSTSDHLIRARTQAEERKRAAEAASEAKSSFLATLSHEIRTPMNGILGMAEALQEADLPPEATKQTRILREASELLLSLLNDVLDMSKIEAGHLTLEEGRFNLHSVVERVAALHRPEAERKGLAMVTRIDPCASGHWVGDEHRLVQVLHNLTGNAVKFTAEGGIVISAEECESGDLLLRVEDSGIGMTKEEADRVFQPFTQADSSTTRRFGGTGLGLTISLGIAHAMGGVIELETAKGEGSCFSIRLPLQRIGAEEEPQAGSDTEETSVLTGRRILVIDDNEVNLAVMETLLHPEEVHLVTASSGSQGIELFQADPAFDLILLDISMPHLDGPATLAKLQALGRPLPPVLAVTAYAMPEDIARFLENGFDGFVAKPIKRAALLEATSSALSEGRETGAATLAV